MCSTHYLHVESMWLFRKGSHNFQEATWNFNTFRIIFFFSYFSNIFEINFYMVKRELPAEKDTTFYLYVT